MAGELGKASLDLEANLGSFERNVGAADVTADRLKDTLEAVAAIANVAERELNDVKMSPGQGAESRISAQGILEGVRGISDASRDAAYRLDKVKLTEGQAAETEASAGLIDRALNAISRNADQAKRKLTEVRLAGGRNGVGVGIFGSGFGRVGLAGAGIGLGIAASPAAVPGALGLLAGIPGLAIGGAGALGTLMLAFDGVTKAIGGDKKAFEDLSKPAQQFVLTVRSLDGWFDKLRQTAAGALFPGLTAGLKAALSPGTVNAITTAVTELGHALGAAGAQWGRYFGSREFQSIFGPLMQSAARNIGVLSDAFLHLFDAIGVIARAAIPFVNWLNDAIDKGAKLADTWIHAKDASGALGRGMSEAEKSLRLVGGLALALVKVVIALGVALYPVAKVAVKYLTDGLNALAGIIHRNQGEIRAIVGGALSALKTMLELLIPVIGGVIRGIAGIVGHMGGWKTAFELVISGFLAAKFVILGKSIYGVGNDVIFAIKRIAGIGSAAVAAEDVAVPAITAIGLAASAAALGGVAVLTAGLIASYIIVQKLSAALGSLPTDKQATAGLSVKWRKAHPKLTAEYERYLYEQGQFDPSTGKFVPQPGHHALTFMQWLQKFHPGSVPGSGSSTPSDPSKGPKPGTHAWYMKYLGFDPTQQPTFGPPPPFTKNTGGSGSGSKSAIPQNILNLEALAARQDQAAAALNYAGARARAHLDKEISDLQQADALLEAKMKHVSGKRRTALYKLVTENLKKIAEARKRIGQAIAKGRQAELNFALDQAKAAVEKATQGSKAWDKAVAAEEKALKAEINYWSNRAKNDKLSAAVRDQALRKELEYEKQLKALLAPVAQAAAANEAQFLQSFVDIQNTFAPNAVPFTPSQGSSGKTNTHLHEIKNEARQTNRHLQAIRDAGRHPATASARAAAMAVGA